MSTHSRPARVAQQIQEEIAGMLLRGAIKDPRVGMVTITGCECDRELRHATIFYSMIEEGTAREETQRGLQSAAGYFRREVAQNLRLRHAPEIHFKFDASVETGANIERLLRSVKEPDKGK